MVSSIDDATTPVTAADNTAAPKRAARKAAKKVGKPAKAAKKTAKVKTEQKPKIEKKGEQCHCGCGEMTRPGSRFLPGHDARFHGRVKKVKDGRLSMDELTKLTKAYALPYYKTAIADKRGKH